MKIDLINRNEFTDIFSKKTKDPLTPHTAFSSLKEIADYSLKDDQAFIVWPSSKADILPVCMIVSDSKVRDWLAWLVTFAPTLRPFTAYCRVIDLTEMRMMISQSNDETFPMGLLGMILGEVITAEGSKSKTQFQPYPVSLYATTLSFSLARTAFVSPGIDFHLISERWARIRKLTEQRERSISANEIVNISTTLMKAAGLLHTSKKDAMDVDITVCSDLESHGPEKALLTLSKYDSWRSTDLSTMDGTRGDRVKVFEKIVAQLRENKGIADGRPDFIVGFLASMIAPGSLAHIGLLMKNIEHFPLSAIWYASCASIADRRKFLSEMEGIGRRILRDLVSKFDISNQPTCDLALPELEVYLDARNQYRDFLISVPNYLSVELTPGAETFVSWRPNKKIDSPVPPRDDQELQLIADEAYTISERLHSFAIKLNDIKRKTPQQQKLFDDNDRSAGTTKRKYTKKLNK